MIGTLEHIVSQMTANGDSWRFDIGMKGYINLIADTTLLPAVLLDIAQSSDNSNITMAGINESMDVYLYFLYESNFNDWTHQQHYDNAISKAKVAVNEFISLCQNSSLIDEISGGKGSQLINFLDRNTSGVSKQFTIKLSVNKSVCV